ncbi:putative FAD-dependent pyridine nucleotide-disulphide oxidoreductase [Streptomyces sp. Y2F8-2]|uniref:NAD(P)/FAD-dependent oxidoreductase n=1 Tax=Streptomyces sp. Y2F8-2 TaxID=2759675 RepID=UPI00190865E8|nr:NAD(P)/FAD-dependent oxidoreductase [Streptomyces sp. Y2F8-2]GHK01793.1 putative FAD-dependent pyridine nucleotide-disulphide oxidoreductase [Streptomyces sp. Y2F8-2]
MSDFDVMQAGEQTWDVVVVGGGAAGLSAALTLARVRRSVLVIDAGEPRNAPAVGVGVHGILGHDGISPLELLRLGREEVLSYGGRVVAGRVAQIRRDGAAFSVVTEGGQRVRARRVLATTGLVDELPDVPGLAERWGRDVVHCVYCHGWEIRDRTIGVLGSFHQALLFRQMSKHVTLFRHTGAEVTDEQWEQLAALGVAVVDGEVTGLEADGEDRLAGVRLASGVVVPVQELVVAPRFVARAGFLDGLGLTVREHPMGVGEQLEVDGSGFTGVPGVWAAGNVSDVLAGVPAATAAGVTAAAAIHMDLLTADATAAASRVGDGNAFSGRMEAEVSRRVLGARAHGLKPFFDAG